MTGAPFRHVGIAGTGLIGGSVAQAVRRAWPEVTVSGFDEAGRAVEARDQGWLDRAVPTLDELGGADLILVAVPMGAMLPTIEAVARLGSTAVVTDVGSTKRHVLRAARAASLPRFVGGHPMAGAERPGLSNARADLFRGRPWLLCRGTAPADDHEAVQRFVEGLGATAQWWDAEAHDRAMAYVSHLPQLIATTLMNTATAAVGPAGLAAAGPGFADMTRLASSPIDVWTGILEQNGDFIAEALAAFDAQLPEAGRTPWPVWVAEAFARAAAGREQWRVAQSSSAAPVPVDPSATRASGD